MRFGEERDDRTAFQKERDRLEEAEGRSLTDQEIGWLLGVQPRHVHNLKTWDDEQVRPSYLLALKYAREVGFETADGVIDTPPDEFDDMVSDLPLECREIARLLGISPSQLWRLRQDTRDADVPRSHFLALRYLMHVYGPEGRMHSIIEHANTYAEHNHTS
jgi:DNA-directed RNA polymerase specialized sigma subunit